MGFFSSIAGPLAAVVNPVGALGTLASVGGGIADFVGQQQTNSQNQAIANQNNAVSLSEAQQNEQMQLDFAQNGISWRIADAAKNGISPLAALGASEPSYSPVMPVMSSPSYQSPLSTIGPSLSSVGQNLTRALEVTKSPEERQSAALSLARQSKENDLLDQQIALAHINVMKASQSPGVPGMSPAFSWVQNADGTTSKVPTYNPNEIYGGKFGWSLDNVLLPSLDELGTNLTNGAYGFGGSSSVPASPLPYYSTGR